MPIFRSTCPRHCYSSCSMLSYINGKKLTRVLGDPEHSYTDGRLCSKGYALIQYALDRSRLKYPMRKVRRGSDEWQQISWQEAYEIITHKILSLHSHFKSNLALGYYKGTGNTGFLHQAVEGMFASLGPHTRPVGDICFANGEIALRETLGELISSDPEDMAQSNLIVLWGSNPAVTNVNQMKFIFEANKNGAPFVVIDPLLSQSAKRADFFIQINPGTDAWLAWGVAKLLLANNWLNHDFILNRTIGFQDFKHKLKAIDLDEVCTRTGIQAKSIEELTRLYYNFYPAANLLGFGMQRNRFGVQSIKAVSALAALTGNFGVSGGGIYYRQYHRRDFPQFLANQTNLTPSDHAFREIPANDFARKAQNLSNPPLKLLWISCANPLAQDHNLRVWNSFFNQLDLIVTVDLYLTQTARHSDLVLPAASFFEEEDLHLSYWHHWLTLNQKVLPAYYEAKSDLQIARELTQYLNSSQQGFSSFPSEKEPLDWIKDEITPKVRELYGLTRVDDLNERSYKRKKEDISPTWKYHFSPPQTRVYPSLKSTKEYILLTPQSLLSFHTQYESLSWLNSEEEPIIEISEEIANRHRINNDQLIEMFNENGLVQGRAKINSTLPPNIILAKQSDKWAINSLIGTSERENSVIPTYASIPYYDCMVNLHKVR